MSYEIIYGKQFIKLTDDKIIPVLYWGSNNCYEVGRNGGPGRRERSFTQWAYICNEMGYNTHEGLINACNTYRQSLIESNKDSLEKYPDWETYDDKSFGYFSSLQIGASTRSTTFKSLLNVVNDGVKKALTVEQIRECGGIVYCRHYEYNSGDFKKANGIDPINANPATSAELLAIMENAHKTHPGHQLHIGIGASDWVVKRLKEVWGTRKPKERKEPKDLPFFYTLKCTKVDGYFVKFTRNGYRYGYYETSGKVFESEAKAMAFKKRMRNPDVAEVVRIDRPIRARV